MLQQELQQWKPEIGLLAPKVEPVLSDNFPLDIADRYKTAVAPILNCRRQLLEREEVFILNAVLQVEAERYVRYDTARAYMRTPLRIVYNDLLAAIGTRYGELTGQFLIPQEWEDIAGDNPRGALWLSDMKRKFYEVEFLANPTRPAHNFMFPRVAGCRTSVTTFRILLMTTIISISWDISYTGRCRDYTVCAMDGTFDSKPLSVLTVYTDWNFMTFAVQTVMQLMDSRLSFQSLWDHWRENQVVNRGDLRIFLIPRIFNGLLCSILALLSDNEELGEERLATLLPEVIWDGTFYTHLLSEVLPPPGECDLLIMVGRPFRRKWMPIGTGDDFPIATADIFQEYAYRKLGPWHGNGGRLAAFVHVHRLPYLSNPLYNYHLDDPVIIMKVQRVLRAVYFAADLDTRWEILQYREDWGEYLEI
jgi:hypothetical protein